jgi:hypothetical protein
MLVGLHIIQTFCLVLVLQVTYPTQYIICIISRISPLPNAGSQRKDAHNVGTFYLGRPVNDDNHGASQEAKGMSEGTLLFPSQLVQMDQTLFFVL